MRKYETLFIIRPGVEDEARIALIEKFKAIIEKDGEIQEVNEWGTKKLQYEIKKFKEGYYVLVNFLANPDLPKELERNFRISEDIIRYVVINKEDK